MRPDQKQRPRRRRHPGITPLPALPGTEWDIDQLCCLGLCQARVDTLTEYLIGMGRSGDPGQETSREADLRAVGVVAHN